MHLHPLCTPRVEGACPLPCRDNSVPVPDTGILLPARGGPCCRPRRLARRVPSVCGQPPPVPLFSKLWLRAC